EIHAGFLLDQMPVPERREGNGMTATCFSFNLPPGVTNMNQAKKFVADKYGVLPEMIIKLGESYFSHHGITPQRIYPFAVVVPPGFLPDPKTAFLPFYQMRLLRWSLSRDSNFGIVLARAYRFLGEQAQLDSRLQLQSILRERFAENQPRWITPHTYIQAPILKAAPPQAAPVPEASPEIAPVMAPVKKPAVKKKLTDDYAKRPHKETPSDAPPPPVEKFVPPTPPAKDAALPRLIDQFAEELEEFFKEQDSFENKPTLQKW
ncbi:MAG: hypothetical protein IT558_03920, partial [Alphaproteobacteria bacterium]|nr:hypothetical protein [Alphaproteobacteria bacterium]